ncbi:hypothetical protein GIB67_008845, partial [Kingdonia uniflora]
DKMHTRQSSRLRLIEEEMNENFYEMMKKVNQKVGTYHIQCYVDKPWLFDLCSTGRGWDKYLVIVQGSYENVKGDDPYRLQHKVYNPSPTIRSWANLSDYIDALINLDEEVQQPKVTHHKRCRALGEDDAKDVEEELTASEWEEPARAKAASMAELCDTDPNKASMRMKKSMYQTDAWAQTFNKAQKVAIRQLKLKEFIDNLGYDPDAFQRLPMNLWYDTITDDAVRAEGAEVDVAGVGARVGDGAETPVVDRVADATVTEGVVGADGSNPSTEGTAVIGDEETGGGNGMATPI